MRLQDIRHFMSLQREVGHANAARGGAFFKERKRRLAGAVYEMVRSTQRDIILLETTTDPNNYTISLTKPQTALHLQYIYFLFKNAK